MGVELRIAVDVLDRPQTSPSLCRHTAPHRLLLRLVRSLDFVEVKGVCGPDGAAHPWVCLKPQSPGT
jgi:hypothetical protein